MEEKYEELKKEHEELLREREFHREIDKLLIHDFKNPIGEEKELDNDFQAVIEHLNRNDKNI